MLVMKFGGTSVAGADPIRQVGRIVRRFVARRPVVVVSAMAGITDELLAAAHEAQGGRTRHVRQRVARIEARHRDAALGLALDGAQREAFTRSLDALLAELKEVLHGVSLLRELSRRSLDLLASFGERLSARLIAAHLRSAGIDAEFDDARELIVTNDSHGAALVQFDATLRNVRKRLLPAVRAGRIPIVTGFIGRSRDGATTTLGRSGSDYTASILGMALRASEVWIWKEVDGVCTADPSLVPDARVVPRISYEEAAEMSHFGAEVIHPKTILPAKRLGIPIRIKNTFSPEAPGTVIAAKAPGSASRNMVSNMDGMALVTIEGAALFGEPGMVVRLLAPVAAAGANIYMISMSSSEYNLSFAIREDEVERTRKALEADFRERGYLDERMAQVRVERGMSCVAVVGAGMKGQRGIAGRVFSALGDHGVNVVAIAQGSSEYNITVVVKATAMAEAVRAIHARVNAGLERSASAARPRKRAAAARA